MKIFSMDDEVSETGHRRPWPVYGGCRRRLGEERPVPGLVCVCTDCAAIQVFGDDLKLRELTDEERRELPAETLREHEDTVRYNQEMEEWRADPEAAERRAERRYDEEMKQGRSWLDRLDELTSQGLCP
jgi:hypothetical protein